MEIFEDIICFLFAILIIVLAIFGLLLAIKMILIYPISKYYLKKKTNRIQWKAVETYESSKKRLEKGLNTDIVDTGGFFDLYWRILPSELPTFIRIFGDNNWNDYDVMKFTSKKDFTDFANRVSTYDSLNVLLNKDEIVWIEP